MPDISMCRDEDCPLAEDCYRYVALPSKFMQSYFAKSPREPGAQTCPYFMKNEPGDRVYTK